MVGSSVNYVNTVSLFELLLIKIENTGKWDSPIIQGNPFFMGVDDFTGESDGE